jgi:hypothetical protein
MVREKALPVREIQPVSDDRDVPDVVGRLERVQDVPGLVPDGDVQPSTLVPIGVRGLVVGPLARPANTLRLV